MHPSMTSCIEIFRGIVHVQSGDQTIVAEAHGMPHADDKYFIEPL